MFGLGGSALPAGLPLSVSGIGSVRTGIRLRCWASASVMTASAASNARPETARFIMLCDAMRESTIPPVSGPYFQPRSGFNWCPYFNQVA
jgi:hypothetical protein